MTAADICAAEEEGAARIIPFGRDIDMLNRVEEPGLETNDLECQRTTARAMSEAGSVDGAAGGVVLVWES